MDTKKKNLLGNLRMKTKIPNLKKPRGKPLAKQGRNLAHRRSISVPDLTLVPGDAVSANSALLPSPSDAFSFGMSSGMSDTDSIASGSTTDGSLFMEKLNDSTTDTEMALRVPQITPSAAAFKRMSAPPETLNFYENVFNMSNSGTENNMNFPQEGLYAQVDKRAKKNVRTLSTEPTLERRNAITNVPTQDREKRLSLSAEGATADWVLSGNPATGLNRVYSFGDEKNTYKEKLTLMLEQKKPLLEKGIPPAITENASADGMSLLDTPLESADGTSVDSAGGTPSEEQVNAPWSTEWDEEEEASPPLLMRELSMDEGLLEFGQVDECLEDEMSSEACDLFDENAIDPFENTDVPTPALIQRYLLSINLKQGKNLVIRDKRSGTSDPYVKFKLEGKQFYKSKVVYKNLNPHWNDSFSHPLRDREHVVDVRVYNKNLTADDFMGSSTISLKDLELHKTYEMELPLYDRKSKEDDMGVILVDVCLMYRDATIKRGHRFLLKKNKATSPRLADTQKNQLKNRTWTGVLHITLVEGQDLPQYGHGDIYVRFRLGDQKYKSKNLCVQANPQWREQFDFNQFEDNQEPLQVEVFLKRGRKGEESWGMFENDLSRLPVNERQFYTHALDPGKGKLVFLVTLRPCWGVSISDIENSALSNNEKRDTVIKKFSLRNSHRSLRDVGFLQVNVIRANDLPATDLNGKSNPLCVIELGNCKLQTDTAYKTLNPEWNKAFTFPIKDIHDVIEFTVFDENGEKSANFLGKVTIPLLSVKNGQQICLFLKKEDLGRASKGTITLVLEVIYNKVRAGIRTFQPKEEKLIEDNPKFNKKVLARNIYRVRKISTAVLYTLQYIKSCFQWESTQRSLIAFLIFLVTVWHWELFMMPLFLLLLIGWNYVQLSTGKASSNQDLVNMTMGDDEEEDEKESGKKGLMDKIHMVQEVVLVVQTVLEEIANIGERTKNIFNWSVPFLSGLACLVLFVAATLLYFIPLRYIVLLWGVNKFTKKLRSPYTIDSNEILDFLKRVPSDIQKVQYSLLRAPTSQNRKKK
ncbi:multiple C2 and transmembrane domain-containing protein 2 isoform X2 [Melanotaenia boesemani]|uniref:multiple C2 and transmembrane domain-containing protein 2 isoform X2 n=1 Tax=Melanotaenia boesemani TaxID=1250792 RepID=UPI001C04D1E5|nr:multiple C2 and transmembrane domain-containing protein 2 isoform X2 [Melanotaenia boesemani]